MADETKRPGGWVDGIGWCAILAGLEVGTVVRVKSAEFTTQGRNMSATYPVVVVRWPDGQEPSRPTQPGMVTAKQAVELAYSIVVPLGAAKSLIVRYWRGDAPVGSGRIDAIAVHITRLPSDERKILHEAIDDDPIWERVQELTQCRTETEADPDGGWAAHDPFRPGCRSQGESETEAIENLRDARRAWDAAVLSDGASSGAENP